MALTDVMDALADQIQTALDPSVEYLQVVARLNSDPTPPSIDIYPASPFMEGLGFRPGNVSYRLSVRARVTTAAQEDGQDLLLELMDPLAATSLTQAILSDRTLSGSVSDMGVVESPTGYGVFSDAGGAGTLLGAVWTVHVLP